MAPPKPWAALAVQTPILRRGAKPWGPHSLGVHRLEGEKTREGTVPRQTIQPQDRDPSPPPRLLCTTLSSRSKWRAIRAWESQIAGCRDGSIDIPRGSWIVGCRGGAVDISPVLSSLQGLLRPDPRCPRVPHQTPPAPRTHNKTTYRNEPTLPRHKHNAHKPKK
ncbi:unnamed protein product [Ectocarpus sp. 8 AP-2014]